MAQFKMCYFCLLILIVVAGIYEIAADTTKRSPVFYSPAYIYFPTDDNSESETYEGCPTSFKDPDGDCIPGTAILDYPVYSTIPRTGFSCNNFPSPGYYADTETGCQVFHVCQLDGRHDKTLCPNGTIFNQKILACDWWYNTDCTSSSYYYIDNEIIFNSPVKYPPSHYYNSGEHDSRSYGRHGYDTSVQVRHYGSPPLIHFNQRLNSENYENVITSTTPNYNQFDYDKPTSKPPLTQDSREYDNSGEARFPESAYHGYWTLVSPRPENGYNESPNYNNQLSQSLVLHYDPVDSVTYSSFDTGLGYDSSEKTHSYQVKKRQSQNTVTRNKKSPENSKTTI